MRITRTDGMVIGEFASIAEAVASGADLSGANLCEADLRGANLREANLREANLSRANLREADLSRANLREAILREADLSGVRWNSAILTNAEGAPWHFGLGRHVAIVHEGQISIGCMTEPLEWWLAHYEAVGKTQGYSAAEIAEYGAWIQFVADRLKLRDGDAKAA